MFVCTRARAHTEVRAQPWVLSLRNHLPCVWRHETLSLAGTWRALIQLDGNWLGLPSTGLTTEPTPSPAPLVQVLSIGEVPFFLGVSSGLAFGGKEDAVG